jgi:ATP-dependent Clp protease ATP-binding subunit ClpA
VEPLHLLAGVTDDQSSRSAQLLRNVGITRERIMNAIREKEATPSSGHGLAAFDAAGVAAAPPVYSKRALAVNFLARVKARLRGATAIETEDLLIALLVEDQERFMETLASVPGVGIDRAYVPGPHQAFLPLGLSGDLIAQIEALCSHSEALPPTTDIPMSEGMRRSFAIATLLRGALQQPAIEPVHLLAAVAGAEQSRAAQVLREAGITGERVLRAIREEQHARPDGAERGSG